MNHLKKRTARHIRNVLPFVLIALAFAFQLISTPTTFLLFFGAGLMTILIPAYELFTMDFNFTIDNLELKDFDDDLNN